VTEAVAGLADAGHLGAGLGELLAAGPGQPSSRPYSTLSAPASPMAPTSSEETPTARSAKPSLSNSARTLSAVTEDAVWTPCVRPGTAGQATAASMRTTATAIRRSSATSCGAERQRTLLDKQQEPALVLLEDLAFAAFAPAERTSPGPGGRPW
jgi:hypothetical protein